MTQTDLFFWTFMLSMNMLIPLTMICFGSYFKKKVPEEINDMFGYRTTMSMRNNKTWMFAHHYAGRLWLTMGIGLFPITLVTMCFIYGKDIETIGMYSLAVMFFQLIPLCGVFIPTEVALRKKFDKEGNEI